MKPRRLVLSAGFLAFFALPSAGLAAGEAGGPRALTAELRQQLARLFPIGSQAELERGMLRRVAEGRDLTAVEVRTLAEAGGPPVAELDPAFHTPAVGADVQELTATGDEIAIVFFLARLRYLPRPGILERAEILAVAPRRAHLVARVAFPSVDPVRIAPDEAADLLERVDRHPSWVTTLVRFASETRGLPFGVSGVRFGPDGTLAIDGSAVGSATPEAVRRALIDAGVEEVELRSMPEDRCLAITAKGRVATVTGDGLDGTEGLGEADLLEFGARRLCAALPESGSLRAEARGDAGTQGVTLRTRGATTEDLLYLLAESFGQPAAGPGIVGPRLDLELTGVSLDEALAALDRAGITLRRFGDSVLGPGSAPARPPDQPYEGEPVSAEFQCADLADLLALFDQISGLDFRPDPDVQGCVAFYARSRPWDEIVDMIFAAAGLAREIRGTTVLVSLAPGSAMREARAKIPPFPSNPRWRPGLDKLSAQDLRLVALLGNGSGWRAFAHGPLDLRYELVAGAELADARVDSIDGRGVTLSAGKRSLRLDLP